MENDSTPSERPPGFKPFNGKEDGKCFTSENQPTPEQRAAGWKKKRAARLLTQEIIKQLIGEDMKESEPLKAYVGKLIELAKEGNPKAIDAINSRIEDEVIKVANTNADGEDVQQGPFVVKVVKSND